MQEPQLLKDEVYQHQILMQIELESLYKANSQYCTNDYDICEKNTFLQ